MRRGRAVVGMAVAALEGLARGPQRGREVEVGAAADAVADDDLGALALHQPVDARQVLEVHRLAEVGVLVAAAALEHHHARALPGGAVELREPVGGDRPAEPGPDDADVDALGHQRSLRKAPVRS